MQSLPFTDMELRNTYMYGLDVLFHTQLLQVCIKLLSCSTRAIVALNPRDDHDMHML